MYELATSVRSFSGAPLKERLVRLNFVSFGFSQTQNPFLSEKCENLPQVAQIFLQVRQNRPEFIPSETSWPLVSRLW